MIFDINAFIGKWPYWPVRASAAAEVAEELRGWGIERAAVCSTRSLFVDWEDGNCEAERAAKEFPQFEAFACVGTLELSHKLPDRKYDFQNYVLRGFRGIRLYPQHHSYHPLFAEFVDDVLEEAASNGLPVLLPLRVIMNWGMPSLDPALMAAVVERHPGVNWILAGINYLHELEMAVAMMRRHETVHLETSCIMGFEAIAKTVARCGRERLLFGTAAPIQHGAAGVEKIMRARIPEDAREAIFAGNALRLLRLAESNS